MKALHVLARGEESARGEELVHYDSPRAMILTESKPWFARWSRDAGQTIGKLKEAQERVKSAASAEPPIPAAPPARIRSSINSFKNTRGLSLDFWNAGDVKEAPQESLVELGQVFEGDKKLRRCPFGLTATPISLIPKPGGGLRPIGVTQLLCAIFLKSQSGFLEGWEEEHMKFWEDAVKGSSALRAGLDRRLMDEVAVLQGKETAAVYWDIEKFYDSIDWVRLIDWCLELLFPARIL